MASSQDLKLIRQTKFPPEFSQKVDMKKVNIEVMKKWIAGKISEILGSEDDVVIELCFNLLEGARYPDIKLLQIQLTGFLDKDTAKFCKELWLLCLSAQSNPQGVPKELLEAKKLELIQEKIDSEKAAEEAKRRKETERQRERNVDNIRQRERGERFRGRGGRGGRPGFGDGRRELTRYSRSPPPRRRSPMERGYHGPPPRRDKDTYVPPGREPRYGGRRPRSPVRRNPSQSVSRSRSSSPRRRNTSSPSPPPRRRDKPGKDWRGHGRGDDRARSLTPSDTSRSRSPRRRRHDSISRSPSRSSSPPPSSHRHRTARRRRRYSDSPSPSPSPRSSYDGRPRPKRRRSHSSSSERAHRRDARADDRKGHQSDYRSRDELRSSQRDRLDEPRAHRDNDDRRRQVPAAPRRAERERSPSPKRQRPSTPERRPKRHRSLERYAPIGRRPRNTSSTRSPSPSADKRHENVEEAPPSRRKVEPTAEEPLSAGVTNGTSLKVDGSERGSRHHEENDAQSPGFGSPDLTASELRERLLKEKVMAMRKSSADQNKPHAIP